MSRFRRVEIFEPCYPPSLFIRGTSIFTPKLPSVPSFAFDEEEVMDELSLALGFLNPNRSPFDLFDSVADLIKVEKEPPSRASYKKLEQRAKTDLLLQKLSDKVSALESKFDQLANGKKDRAGDRKYSLTAEVKGPVERRYKWTAEIKDESKKEEKSGGGVGKNYKWTAEFKGKADNGEIPISRKFTFEASNGHNAVDHSKPKKKEKKKKEESRTRLVQIEDPTDDGALVLRRAFAKRAGALRNNKGKGKELSPQDAALLIQMTFRAYLIRKSQALRALRELAIAKAKLKEIRASFNNFSYRRHIADAEEHQKFTEKIIVLLLTVDSIEGSDLMVRAAKRSMVDELEAMLDVVDPQPAGKSRSIRRRTFDMPDAAVRKELAEGVANIVHLLDGEDTSCNFEACL